MILTRPEKALLSLLRAGLWNKEPDEKDMFPLSEQEWQDVYRLAKEQTVDGLVFQGACMLDEDLMPPIDMMQVWLAKVDQIEQTNRSMNAKLDRLLEWLKSNGIHPVVMKGQGVARYYEEPLQRICGDIDLFLPTKGEFTEACQLTEAKGLATTQEADGACSFMWDDVEVELHQRLIDIHNPWCQKGIAQLIESEGYDDDYPTPLLNILLLSAHLLKHIMGHGVGLRQFADMARACAVLHDSIDTKQYEVECRKLGIENWSSELHEILVDVLGLSPSLLPSQRKSSLSTEYILGKVLKGGNFGQHGTSRNENDGTWKRKWHTAQSFLRDWKQNRRLAPSETFWVTASLALGQFKID